MMSSKLLKPPRADCTVTIKLGKRQKKLNTTNGAAQAAAYYSTYLCYEPFIGQYTACPADKFRFYPSNFSFNILYITTFVLKKMGYLFTLCLEQLNINHTARSLKQYSIYGYHFKSWKLVHVCGLDSHCSSGMHKRVQTRIFVRVY